MVDNTCDHVESTIFGNFVVTTIDHSIEILCLFLILPTQFTIWK